MARIPKPTPAEARGEIFTFIEGWYNTRRRHSAIGYLAPAVFEREHFDAERASTETYVPEHSHRGPPRPFIPERAVSPHNPAHIKISGPPSVGPFWLQY